MNIIQQRQVEGLEELAEAVRQMQGRTSAPVLSEPDTDGYCMLIYDDAQTNDNQE